MNYLAGWDTCANCGMSVGEILVHHRPGVGELRDDPAQPNLHIWSMRLRDVCTEELDVHVRARTHTHKHMHRCTHARVHSHTCTHALAHTHMHTYAHAPVHTHTQKNSERNCMSLRQILQYMEPTKALGVLLYHFAPILTLIVACRRALPGG